MTSSSARTPQIPFLREAPNAKNRRPTSGAERRRSKRFTLRFPLRYRADGAAGTGEVINISSGGVLFAADQDFNPTGNVELFISWPILLDEAVALNLVAFGPVVRTESGKIAIKIHKYEFRTAKATAWKRDGQMPEPRAQMAAHAGAPVALYA